MIVTIHQPQYMAWVGYFHKIASADLFIILNNVQFRKNEWQHRNRIKGPNGAQWLSVPTTYKFPQLINEVGIADDPHWCSKHLHSLESCYGKSHYFENYYPLFKSFFEKTYTMLSACNISSIELLSDCLGLKTPLLQASSIPIDGSSTERLVNICKHVGADTYLAGAGGRDYMDMQLFESAGIEVRFQDFHPPVYPQLWCDNQSEFIPGLSLIDLLFNCGPESFSILMGEKR
jgi:hypothetical protein